MILNQNKILLEYISIHVKNRAGGGGVVHSQKRHRLVASCQFYRLVATSCNKLVNFIKLQQVC